MPEEYEVIPHQLLNNLKFDVEALQKKLAQPDARINELILEIESLKDSIHELQSVFNKALGEIKEDDFNKILQHKLDAVVKQNETIARGMVAISEKLENFIGQSKPVMRAPPMQHSMGPPPSMPGSRVAPPVEASSFPPPPPSVGKKHGLFK